MLSMLSSKLWRDIDSRLRDIFSIYSDVDSAFAGLSALTLGDFLQLPPVRGRFMFSQSSDKNSMKHLLGLHLWHLFKYAELIEDAWQNDKRFIDLLDKVRV